MLIAALVGGVLLIIVLGFVAALRKPGKAEAERIRRSDEMMKRAFRDDPNEPACWVP
jgi:hypothetical protein